MLRKSGFTITEVLFAVAVIAIIAAAVIPRMTRGLFNKYTVYTTAHQVASDARLVRRLAVTTGDRHRLRCYKVDSSDYNRYKIERKVDGDWGDAGEVKTIHDEIVVTVDGEVEFKANGSATGTVEFKYEIGDDKYKVNIKKATGRVKVQTW